MVLVVGPVLVGGRCLWSETPRKCPNDRGLTTDRLTTHGLTTKGPTTNDQHARLCPRAQRLKSRRRTGDRCIFLAPVMQPGLPYKVEPNALFGRPILYAAGFSGTCV